MKTVIGLDKMALAHEIAINSDFRLQPSPRPETATLDECLQNSSSHSMPATPIKSVDDLQKLTKAIVHKAFWDALDSDLKENPPNYDHALVLLTEVKEMLLSLLLAHHTKLRQEIDESIDLELIKQQCKNSCLDFMRLATYVLDVMAKLCAPVRDETIQNLRGCSNLITLYRGILETLHAMKIDMANFAISSLRPVIQQHSIEFEKKKFDEYLAVNPEGLKVTKCWLKYAVDKYDECLDKSHKIMKSDCEREVEDVPTCSSTKVDNSDIVYDSACAILDWSDAQFEQLLPETFVVDADRLKSLRTSYLRMVLTATVVITTVNFGGKAFSGAQEFKRLLKEKLAVLFQDVRRNNAKEMLTTISEYVCSEFEKYAENIGFKDVSVGVSGRKELLKNQIICLSDDENPVVKIVKSRVKSFLMSVMKSKATKAVEIPLGLNIVEKELVQVAALFFRLVSHNVAVFHEYYNMILDELQERKIQVEKSTS
uniref:T-complex protein 11-like protein 1 n=1 Tax=Romanomermis culicivorax TaxID=13658 RepID=A0A915K9H0_ROMCU